MDARRDQEFKRRYETARETADIAKDLLEDKRYDPVLKGYFTAHADLCDNVLTGLLTRRGETAADDIVKAKFLMFKREFFRGMADVPREMIDTFQKAAKKEIERRKKEEEEEKEE